jgi:transposase
VSKPQVIDDAEHARVFDRVAAAGVAKREGVVCLRVPHPAQPRGRRSLVWTVQATMPAVRELAGRLTAEGVQKVTLESTSDYWRIWFYVLEEAGVDVQLVSAHQARQLSGRPKTDKLDAMWLARLTEMGLLRPSFVPPAEIRVLRQYARARARLTGDRTRCWARLEKLLEDALVKVSSVACALTTASVRDMIRAMIAGQRDPQVLAGLARTRMKAKHDALAAALDGMFHDHHAELAQLLLDQIAFIDSRVARLHILIGEQLAAIRAAWGADPDGTTGPGAGTSPGAPVLPAIARLDEVTGIGPELAAGIISEAGLDMTRFPTPGHLASWTGLTGRTIQSGPRTRNAKGQGNAHLRGYLCQAAMGTARTDTFPGERYRRIARRRGPARAQVAVARSICVIVWHLLADPGARYHDLGPGHYQARTDKHKKARSHIRQLQALGYTVTITQAA